MVALEFSGLSRNYIVREGAIIVKIVLVFGI